MNDCPANAGLFRQYLRSCDKYSIVRQPANISRQMVPERFFYDEGMFSCCAKNGFAIFSTTTEHSFIVKKSFSTLWASLCYNKERYSTQSRGAFLCQRLMRESARHCR